ncbi:Zn-ribbon containing protein [Haloterrigena salinisoli]|uniref:OapC/ArvC family zinc-ribbon domain-containing protein n=1 Tax=Haloterrigena salinisoli TaxID=3132747 RepID=UPI0030D0C351
MPHECTNCGRTFPDGSKEMLSGCPDCGGNKFQFAPAARAATGTSESATANAADSAGDPGGNAAEAADDAGTVERAAETVRDWVSSDTNRSANQSPTDVDDQTEHSWPSSDDPADGADATPAGQFEEWPETARRPEDRSPSDADASSASTPTADASTSSTPTPDASSASTPTADASPSSSSANAAAEAADSPDERSIMADSENDAQADARTEVVSTNDLPDKSPQSDRVPDAPSDEAARAAEPGDGTDAPPSDGRVVSEPSGEQPSIEELREELNEQFESIKIVSPGQYELNLMELYNREEYIISLQEDGRYVIDVPDSWRDDEE